MPCASNPASWLAPAGRPSSFGPPTGLLPTVGHPAPTKARRESGVLIRPAFTLNWHTHLLWQPGLPSDLWPVPVNNTGRPAVNSRIPMPSRSSAAYDITPRMNVPPFPGTSSQFAVLFPSQLFRQRLQNTETTLMLEALNLYIPSVTDNEPTSFCDSAGTL